MPIDYSREYLARWMEPGLGDYLASIAADEAIRAAAVGRLTSSIALAQSLNAARWGLTKSPSHLRLNVGRLEALLWRRDVFALMVHLPTLGRKLALDLHSRGELKEPESYASAPDSTFAHFRVDDAAMLKDRIALVEHAHERHLEFAATTSINGSTRKSHHPAMVDLLADEGRRDLAQPSYVLVSPPQRAPSHSPVGAATLREGREQFDEGTSRDVVQSVRERNSAARRACISHYGTACSVCDVSLEQRYGAAARDLVHVHHLIPIGESDGVRKVNPITDLRPVCPTCHAVIHRRSPPYDIEEVRALLNS